MVNIYTDQQLSVMNQNVFPTRTPTENATAFNNLSYLFGMAIGSCNTFSIGGWNRLTSWTTDQQLAVYNFYPFIIPAIRPINIYTYFSVYTSKNSFSYYYYFSGDSASNYNLYDTLTSSTTSKQFTIDNQVNIPHGCVCVGTFQLLPASTAVALNNRYFGIVFRPTANQASTSASALPMSGILNPTSAYKLSNCALNPAVGISGPLSAGLINGLNLECERLLKQPLVVMCISAPVTSATTTPPTMGTGYASVMGIQFKSFQNGTATPTPTNSALSENVPYFIPSITYSIARWIPYRQGCPNECNVIHVAFTMDETLFTINKTPLSWDSPTITVDICGAEVTAPLTKLWSFTPPSSSAVMGVWHAAFYPIMPEEKKLTVGNRDFWPFKIKNISCQYLDDKSTTQTYTELVQSICVWIGGEVA